MNSSSPVSEPHGFHNETSQWAQKLEAMGRMSLRLAHEVNNHLTLVLARTALLLEDSATSNRIRKDLEEVLELTEHIRGMMREWLTLGRKDRPNLEIQNLNAILSGFLPMIRAALGSQIELTLEEETDPVQVQVDRGQIHQVLINLALNARDAMNGEGKWTLRVRKTDIDTTQADVLHLPQTGPHGIVVLEDTGCGMAPEVLGRIFTPYFTTKTAGQGTGLGLATVWELLRVANGAVTVESTPGKGTTFSLILPLVSSTSLGPSTRVPKVVILGEDELVRDLIADIIKRENVIIEASGSGADVLALCQSKGLAPELLLVDDDLSDAGNEAMTQLVGQSPELKILWIGARKTSQEGPTPSLGMGKPFRPSELLARIRQLLQQVPSGNTVG